MASFSTKFESIRQDWETPDDFFAKIDEEFAFTLDAAASSNNTKVPTNFLTAEQDALSCSWVGNVVWLNPPYGGTGKGSLKAWVEKAYRESQNGATVVLFIPARTNTEWFHDLCLTKGEVRFIRGRPKFKGASHGLPQPLCLVVFRPPLGIGDLL